VLELPEIKAHLGEQGPVLAYLMPKDYVMQGMIADTGGEWQLYKRHHTLAMISDWILHPFRHLENGHAAMHHGMGMGQGAQNGMARRLIFLRVDAVGGQTDPAALFGINLPRRYRLEAGPDPGVLKTISLSCLGYQVPRLVQFGGSGGSCEA
jgi:hypothetical protein